MKGKPFPPGVSGNPGGRPKKDPVLAEMLLAAGPRAVQLLIETVSNESAKLELRVQCANTIIERIMGKTSQPIQAEITSITVPMSIKEKEARLRELLQEV